jgi:undecaprenyl-diphosphatase
VIRRRERTVPTNSLSCVVEVVVPVEPSAAAEPAESRYARSPITAIRLGGALVLVAVMYLALQGVEDRAFTDDFGSLLSSAPRWAVSVTVGVCQLGFLAPAILGILGQLALRHFVRVGRMVLTAVLCGLGLFVMSRLVGSSILPLLPQHGGPVHQPAPGTHLYGIGASFPTTMDLGIISSWMLVDRAHWSGRWRRIGLLVLALGIAADLGVNLTDPATIATAISMAAAASLLVQLVFGAPDNRPRAAVVGDILTRLGYRVTAVERFGGFHGFTGFQVQLADGRQLFTKIVNRDAWAALLPVRLYRTARFRDAGQDRPFRTLRSLVEHEALCSLKAHSDGVPTARLAEIAEFPPDAMLMAFEVQPFEMLSDLAPERRTDDLIRQVWSIVATLQRNHTVHRRLNGDSLLIDDAGRVLLVGFDTASLGVVGPTLSTDVAEVLAATAALVGAPRAVELAVDAVGDAAVAAALPRLQPLALTARTRSIVKAAGGFDELRAEVQRATGTDAVPIAELERIKLRTLATLTMAALALWTLIPQVLGVGSVWSELRHASLAWAGAALALSALTYVAAAVSLAGSLPERLPLAPTIGMQMATSFVGVAAPGGGLALNARFLQKRGFDTGTAIAAVGVDRIAGGIVHLTLTGLFVGLAGTSGLSTFDLPSMRTVGLIVGGLLALVLAGVAVPWSRSLLTTRVLPSTRRSLAGVGEITRQPSKMIELFAGSTAITMGYMMALAVSVWAFGTSPAFTSIALVYLVGSAVAAIAPTPGGIGAVEATLIAGLTSSGMAGTTAVAAVILFRLATFWVPLLPGWGAFVMMQRSGDF